MKASQLSLEKVSYHMSGSSYSGHYKFHMTIGRCLPQSPAQAKHFYSLYKNGGTLSVLNLLDVEKIESMMNKHGLAGDYKYTKGNKWVRLQNVADLAKAYKLEFNF